MSYLHLQASITVAYVFSIPKRDIMTVRTCRADMSECHAICVRTNSESAADTLTVSPIHAVEAFSTEDIRCSL